MNKRQIQIKGMHCRSCEILIEDELTKVNGITAVSVDHASGLAQISCEFEPDPEEVRQAVNAAGYAVGKDGKLPYVSKNFYDYSDLGIAFFIVFALYIVARALGLFHLGNSVSGNFTSLPIVLLIGLTAGISTCMALVGGLVLGASARFSAKHPRATGLEKFTPHLYFNIGRIASYFVLGGVVGFAGSIFQISTSILGILTVTVGFVMLLLGGQLIDIFPILKKLSFTMPKGISRMLGIKNQSQSEYSNKNSMGMGAMTFFLPCGFTQAMQLYAMSTGSPIQGALTLGVFAIGTAPGLLGVGGLASVIKGNASRIFFKSAGLVVIALSLFNITNGFNLIGISPLVFGAANTRNTKAVSDPNVKLVNGVQEVRMTQHTGGYSPNKFTIQKGIPVRWIINSTDVYTCAASILSQKIGVRKGLTLGENIIEFTPSENGTITFSCSMGMYTGSFTVGDAIVEAEPQALANGNSCGGGGCGCGAKKAVIEENNAQPAGKTVTLDEVQVIKTTYTNNTDIQPNTFTVKANQPVRFEVDAQDDGVGCMGSITIPNLVKKVDLLTKGEKLVYEFTPSKKGTYYITCAMGMPRGQITVI